MRSGGVLFFFFKIQVMHEEFSFNGLRMSDKEFDTDISFSFACQKFRSYTILLKAMYRHPTFRSNIFSHFCSEFTGRSNYIISPCLSLLTVNMKDKTHLQ